MEIKLRMSKRFVAWLSLALVALVALGLLVACGTLYSPSSDGLMLVGSQGSALIETYSFNLSNGHISSVSNPPSDTSTDTCVLPGLPGSMVVDPTGAYGYVILTANSTCPSSKTAIASFKINSNGTIPTSPTTQPLNTTTAVVTALVNECGVQTPVPVSVTAPVVPYSMFIDAAGKFLFVADRATTTTAQVNYTCNGSSQSANVEVTVPGTVSAFTVASGSLTEVSGSPFAVPPTLMPADIRSVAATPTVFPSIGLNGVQNSICTSQNTPAPTQQFLYAADFENNVVWVFGVNMSSGILGNPGVTSSIPSFAAGSQPSGVAVDPCNRFVFVSNYLSNNVSAYTICNGSSTSAPPPACPQSPSQPDGSLVAVNNSPFSLPGNANGPGPMLVDPFGNFLYVLEGTTALTTGSITPFQISPVSGGLTSKGIVATGAGPVSMAIRGDDNWLFVANYVAGTVSQYAITPATGALGPQPVVQTDSYPWGVAVK
jgi:hypothetical protein